MASKQNADLVHHTNEGVEFHEDRANGSNKVVLRRPASLDSDVYIEFPTTSGTISTQTYVANATGGTFVGLSSDYTNTDATSTPANVTGMSFAVEANRTYAVEGVFIMADVAAASAGCLSLSLPSGASFIGHQIQPRPGSFTVTSTPWTESYASGVGSAQAGEVTNYDSNGLYGVPITFSIVLNTSSTAGTVQLVLTNRAGDGTEQGLRKGSYIRIIDPQG